MNEEINQDDLQESFEDQLNELVDEYIEKGLKITFMSIEYGGDDEGDTN